MTDGGIMLKFHILTLFPEMIQQGLSNSIIGRATDRKQIEIHTVNIREFSNEKHGKVDDYTYGGGAGMLMQAQPVYDAWKSVGAHRTIYVTPQGRPFTQAMAADFATENELTILCGHYEGIDERVLEETVSDYVSIGDYVLTGGELAAMVIVDAVSRLVPGVLGNETSADTESFQGDLLEYPQYTRPEVWHEKSVPAVLLTGNHEKIAKWRTETSVLRTKERRPDLYERYAFRQSVIQHLMKHKRDNIHMIECLRRGGTDILYACGEDILLYNARCRLGMITVSTQEKGRELLQMVHHPIESFVISQEFMIAVLQEQYGMHVDMKCVNACYTQNVPLGIRNKDLEIRPLTSEQEEYVCRHYQHGNSAYIRERIAAGMLFGGFLEGKIVAFVGEHEEGSLGMLYVDPAYRRQGIGETLEAYMVNRHRIQGFLPYGQIEIGNAASMSMQKKHGLYLSEGFIWWMSAGDKWSGQSPLPHET